MPTVRAGRNIPEERPPNRGTSQWERVRAQDGPCGCRWPRAAGQEAQCLRSSIHGERTEPPTLPCRALSVPPLPLPGAALEKLLQKGRRARNASLCSGLPSQPGTAVTSGGCTAPFICRCAVQRAPVSSASFWGDLPRSEVGLKFPLEKLWAIRMVSVLWGL